ncbi:unnamed protein product [Alternaria alternata]
MADWAACVVALAGVEDLIDCVREDEPDSQFCSVAKGDDNGVYHPLDTTKDGLLCWSVYKDARIWSRKAANWVHEICMHTELKNQSLIDGDKGHIDHINKVDRESAYQL